MTGLFWILAGDMTAALIINLIALTVCSLRDYCVVERPVVKPVPKLKEPPPNQSLMKNLLEHRYPKKKKKILYKKASLSDTITTGMASGLLLQNISLLGGLDGSAITTADIGGSAQQMYVTQKEYSLLMGEVEQRNENLGCEPNPIKGALQFRGHPVKVDNMSRNIQRLFEHRISELKEPK